MFCFSFVSQGTQTSKKYPSGGVALLLKVFSFDATCHPFYLYIRLTAFGCWLLLRFYHGPHSLHLL